FERGRTHVGARRGHIAMLEQPQQDSSFPCSKVDVNRECWAHLRTPWAGRMFALQGPRTVESESQEMRTSNGTYTSSDRRTRESERTPAMMDTNILSHHGSHP